MLVRADDALLVYVAAHTRYCRGCKRQLPLTSFSPDRACGRRKLRCRECMREAGKLWRRSLGIGTRDGRRSQHVETLRGLASQAMTLTEMAAKLGISYSHAGYLCRRYRIPYRRVYQGRHANKQWLIQMIWQRARARVPIRWIGAELGISHSKVAGIILRYSLREITEQPLLFTTTRYYQRQRQLKR